MTTRCIRERTTIRATARGSDGSRVVARTDTTTRLEV